MHPTIIAYKKSGEIRLLQSIRIYWRTLTKVASLTDTDEIKNVADYVNISQEGSLKNIVGYKFEVDEEE